MFVIITKSGKPLTMENEVVILFESQAQAERWLTPGDRIMRAERGIVGTPAIEG
mgnify:CR=1 FL=1